ncbi:hypothetical protein [Persephonella sp.]
MFSLFIDNKKFDSSAEKKVYLALKALGDEMGGIVVHHPKIRRGVIGYKIADFAFIHGNFGIILCEVKGIRRKDLFKITSIENGKIRFESGEEIEDPWEQVIGYRNLLTSNTNNKYYISAKVILPYITSVEFKKIFPDLYSLYKDDTIFKEDLEKNNLEKLFTGIPTYVSLNKEDIRYLCSSIGVKLDEDKINDISVYKLTTPKGIYYYDKKVLSILKEYGGGLKIIRGLAGTGKTVILIQFLLQKAPELRNKHKKAVILCFNKPLYEYISSIIKEFHMSDIIEVKRINKNAPPENQNLLFSKKKFKYILIDEFQDFPTNIGKYIVMNHANILIFVDETQKIYDEGFDKWSNVLGEKFKPGLLNNYLKIVYRNPAQIYKCSKELLSNDRGLRGYYKVQEVIKNSQSINEIGGLAFYDDLETLLSIIKNKLNDKKYPFNVGIFINESENKEQIYKKEILNLMSGINFDVKSYLRVKGLEYDIIVLKDFWEFLDYYRNNFSYIYRMAYTIITRSKFGVFIPYPSSSYIQNRDIENIYDIIRKHSNDLEPNELLADIKSHFDRIKKEAEKEDILNLNPIKNLLSLGYKTIDIFNNLTTFVNYLNYM